MSVAVSVNPRILSSYFRNDMTGRYIRQAVPLEVRGISHDNFDVRPLPERPEEPLEFSTFDHITRNGVTVHTNRSEPSARMDSDRSTPSTVTESDVAHSLLHSQNWTGNTTERSSLFSLCEDAYDRQASKQVQALFDEIDSMLFENKKGPQHLHSECLEWIQTFPHLRVLGMQLVPSSEKGYETLAGPEGTGFLVDVTDHDMRASHFDNGLAVTGQHINVLQPPIDPLAQHSDISSQYEEILEEDGLMEDIIAVDYTSDDMYSYSSIQGGKSGMPPVAPHECVRENIQSAAFDYVWTAAIENLQTVMKRYIKQIQTELPEEEERRIQHMALRNPSPEILRLEGPDMSPPPELSPVSRELLAAGRDKPRPATVSGPMKLDGLLKITSKALVKKNDEKLGPDISELSLSGWPNTPLRQRPGSVTHRTAERAISAQRRSRRPPLTPLFDDKGPTLGPNAGIRGHRMTTPGDRDRVHSPQPFIRNTTLPPINPDPPGTAPPNSRRKTQLRASSAVHHDPERSMLRERQYINLDNRPSTTHTIYNLADSQVGRRQSTSLGFNSIRSLQLQPPPSPGPLGMQLNVTGSGISPGADGTSQSHLQDLDEQECIDSYIHHPSWGSTTPQLRRPRQQQNFNTAVR